MVTGCQCERSERALGRRVGTLGEMRKSLMGSHPMCVLLIGLSVFGLLGAACARVMDPWASLPTDSPRRSGATPVT